MTDTTTHDAAGTLPAATPVPYVPRIVDDVERLATDGRILTRDGETKTPAEATDYELGEALAVAKRLADLGALLRRVCESEAAHRAGVAGGELDTAAARITLGRPTYRSVSGAASQRVRDVLDSAVRCGYLPASAVDKVAPLVPHVTPAALRDLIAALSAREEQSAAVIAGSLRAHLPEQYRRVTVEPTR